MLKLILNLKIFNFKYSNTSYFDKILNQSGNYPTDHVNKEFLLNEGRIPQNFILPKLKNSFEKTKKKKIFFNTYKKNIGVKEDLFEILFAKTNIIFNYKNIIKNKNLFMGEVSDTCFISFPLDDCDMIEEDILVFKKEIFKNKNFKFFNTLFSLKKKYFIILKPEICLKTFKIFFEKISFFDFTFSKIAYWNNYFSPFNLSINIYTDDDTYVSEYIKDLADQIKYRELNPIKLHIIIKFWKKNYKLKKKKKNFFSFKHIFELIFKFFPKYIKAKKFKNFINIKEFNYSLKILNFKFKEKYLFINKENIKIIYNLKKNKVIKTTNNKVEDFNLDNYKNFLYNNYIIISYFEEGSDYFLNCDFIWEHDYMRSYEYTEIFQENFDCLSYYYIIIYNYWENN